MNTEAEMHFYYEFDFETSPGSPYTIFIIIATFYFVYTRLFIVTILSFLSVCHLFIDIILCSVTYFVIGILKCMYHSSIKITIVQYAHIFYSFDLVCSVKYLLSSFYILILSFYV